MKFYKQKNTLLAGAFFLFISVTPAQAAIFNISLGFSGLDSEQQSYFTQAANYWETIITGYNPSVLGSSITGVTISASGTSIDGAGGALGFAGPQSIWEKWRGTGGYALAKTGIMQFDTVDINKMIDYGIFTSVIVHEMAHVLGFGTLWGLNNTYVEGSGQYRGAYGLAAYRNEFAQASASYVPVELDGGEGTANGHWDEFDNGSRNTGIIDRQGRDMRYELMTGWLDGPTFLSNTTIQSFRDLGYTVAAVPLPGAVWLLGSALLVLLGLNTRRNKPLH